MLGREGQGRSLARGPSPRKGGGAVLHQSGQTEVVKRKWSNGSGQTEVVKWKWSNGSGQMEAVKRKWPPSLLCPPLLSPPPHPFPTSPAAATRRQTRLARVPAPPAAACLQAHHTDCETGPRRGSKRTGAEGAALGAGVCWEGLVPLERGGGASCGGPRSSCRRPGGWGSSVGPAMMGARRKDRTAVRDRCPGRPPAGAARPPTRALGRW